MEPREVCLTHLERLATELQRQGFTAQLNGAVSKPCLQVANADTPTLNERVYCEPAADDSWVFWWPWKQPIGSAADLPGVIAKIAAVLRSVEGA